MNNPQYVKVDNKLYKINTDFRVALECNKLVMDEEISDYERALAIIYKLFGEDGLNCTKMDKLFELGIRYVTICPSKEKSLKTHSRKDYELDFLKCEGLIRSSFKFDYNYDPYELDYLHWYDFYNDLENLSTSEFGSCCILNRIVSILNQDTSKIQDATERDKLVKAQESIKEKYCIVHEEKLTKEQEESQQAFYKALGIEV